MSPFGDKVRQFARYEEDLDRNGAMVLTSNGLGVSQLIENAKGGAASNVI